jgi:hypothetical protein
MLPVTQDVAGMLMSELTLAEDKKPRHSLALDGAFGSVPGLFTVASVQNVPSKLPSEPGVRAYRVGFREVPRG